MLTARAQSQKRQALSPRDRAALVLAEIDDLTVPALVAPDLLSATHPTTDQSMVALLERDAHALAALGRFVAQTEHGALGLSSPRDLIAATGVDTAREALLALSLRSMFAEQMKDRRASDLFSRLWQHSIAVASACRMLCEEVASLGDTTAAFNGGLFHDVGKFALIALFPKSYLRVTRRVGQNQISVCAAERDAFGIDHAEIGAYFGSRIPLTGPVIEAIRQHHDLSGKTGAAAQSTLGALVHVADLVAHGAGIGSAVGHFAPDPDELAAALNAPPGVLASVAERLTETLLPFAAMVATETSDPAPAPRSTRNLRTLSPQQSKRDPPAVVALLNRFLALIGSDAKSVSFRSVCQAAALCARDALCVDSCLAILGSADGDVVFLGSVSHGGGADARSQVVALPASSFWDDLTVPRGASGWVPTGDAFDALWERCFDTVPRGSLCAMPFGLGKRACGALVISGGARDGFRSPEHDLGMDALVRVIELAASVAMSQAEPDVVSEQSTGAGPRHTEASEKATRDETISTIAAMAAGAAHELNNPLSVISGRAQILLSDCDDDAQAKALREIADQAHRASQIVTDLMNYARPEPPHPEKLTLEDLLASLFQHWQACLGRGVERLALWDLDRDLTVFADKKQLAQILEAVIVNAIQATEKGAGRVHVNSPSYASDETVRIVVADDGVGMTHDVLARAFDPFFSFRPAGRGRGLGLSRACRLAEINGGRLRLESKVGSGTTVTIELPARSPRV